MYICFQISADMHKSNIEAGPISNLFVILAAGSHTYTCICRIAGNDDHFYHMYHKGYHTINLTEWRKTSRDSEVLHQLTNDVAIAHRDANCKHVP